MKGRAREREREKKRKKVCKEKREVVQPPCEVVRQLLVVEMMVDRPVTRVVVANGHDRERRKKFMVVVKTRGKRLVFGQLWIQISSCSGHEMHSTIFLTLEKNFGL
jgi:hypothetical protein